MVHDEEAIDRVGRLHLDVLADAKAECAFYLVNEMVLTRAVLAERTAHDAAREVTADILLVD